MNSTSYGLITGRVSSLAFDPSDTTGNHLYLGTTGGGVWEAQNAAVSNGAQAVFRPLTDAVGALNGVQDPSISIGALTVQPGGTGVMLAGTGDPNDALDSYYGAGVLRSADGGNSWSLNQLTADGLFAFVGEGFAGFAWSTVSPNLVVAAVSQAYEATLVNAVIPGRSFEGLYYSTDAGTTWTLATITDGGTAVQGASITAGGYDGNAATSVVWNPVRQLFVAAVRYHGYYSSADGITFTRLAAQPGTGLFTSACPANTAELGSVACPIFRGTLAVNPLTGDTFAWSVDGSNQDQGLWQDQCGISGSACSEQTIGFGKQWNTQALETNTGAGAATIANGDYNLALAAVPYALQPGADTWLFAGANDLWRCSLAAGCVWRNTTNAATCMSGRVAPFQHALAWSGSNPLEIMIGNDGGLWRSLDAVGETGPVCSSTDASHFQNLNGGLGSLAEVETGGFQVSNTCGTQLAGHSACSIDVVFAPVQVGMVTGTLTVSDALRTQTAPLSGTGAQQAVLTPSPASLTFPAGTVGVASLPRTVTVTNTGGVGAATIGFQVTGPAAASFATGTTTCMGNLASGTSCTVQVIFTPTQAGGNVATLTITSSTLGVKAATVAIDGAAMITSGLNVSPAQLAFASTVVGATSAGQQVVVSNTSSFAANGFVVAVTSGFALTQDSCTASLAAGASCTVQVVFKPTTAGAVAGSVTIISGSIGDTATVALSGTGALAAGLQVAPPAISFPVTGVGMAASPVTVTVTNTGTEDALSNLALKASAGFRLVDDICAGTLAPGASCTTGVEFAPTVAGAQTGLLTVTSSTVAAPQPVALSGTGFDFTVTFSGSSTQTIADGQTADYTLVITPLGNGSGTFSFACDSLPTGALCLFNPPGETLNSGVTGNATLSVSTSTATAARYTKKVGPWAVLPLFCGLLLLPFGRGGLSGRAGWWSGVRMLAWLALSVAVLSGLGCTKSGGGTGGGGSKGGSGGTGGTGSGTYTIPVTVSSGGCLIR
jgi:hypothetical protein